MLGVIPPGVIDTPDDSLVQIKEALDRGMLVRRRPQSTYSTAQMYRAYRDRLADTTTLQILHNYDTKSTCYQENRFSRQPKWDSTLNCAYYGLMKLRQRQELDINNPFRPENLLREFTLGTEG